jgi:hypothetical protein
MSEATDLESRVAALDREIAELKRTIGSPKAKEDWIRAITGSIAGYPEFKEILRLEREIRQADRPRDEAAEQPH